MWKIIKSGYNFVYDTTAELLCHVQNCDLIGQLKQNITKWTFTKFQSSDHGPFSKCTPGNGNCTSARDFLYHSTGIPNEGLIQSTHVCCLGKCNISLPEILKQICPHNLYNEENSFVLVQCGKCNSRLPEMPWRFVVLGFRMRKLFLFRCMVIFPAVRTLYQDLSNNTMAFHDTVLYIYIFHWHFIQTYFIKFHSWQVNTGQI